MHCKSSNARLRTCTYEAGRNTFKISEDIFEIFLAFRKQQRKESRITGAEAKISLFIVYKNTNRLNNTYICSKRDQSKCDIVIVEKKAGYVINDASKVRI